MIKNKVLFCFIILFTNIYSQNKLNKTFNDNKPLKAGVMSAIIPGLGQIVNKKYYKSPIIWAAIGTSVYFVIDNNNEYKIARESYLSLLDTIQSNDIPYKNITNITKVQEYKNLYKKNRDLSIVVGSLLYFLNIVDAVVDAHLTNFKLNDNTTVSLGSSILPYNYNSPKMSIVNLSYSIRNKKTKSQY